MSLKWPNKDPNEFLDFSLDWSRFLRSGESVVSAQWYITDESNSVVIFPAGTTISGLTNNSSSNSSTVTIINLSAGTNNSQYKLTCRVTLNNGFIAERSVVLPIKER